MSELRPNNAIDRFHVRELVEEAQRESQMRRRLYDKWVRAGRMTRADADRKIDLMMAIERRLIRTAYV